MALQSWGEQLEDTINAINAVQSSQRYELNGRSLQRADLQWLNQRYKMLVEKVEKYGKDAIVGRTTTHANITVSFT